MSVRNKFLESHPFVQFMYFTLIIFVTIFIPHPIIVITSFIGASALNIRLKGIRNFIKFQLCAIIPTLILIVVINGAFSHYGITELYYTKTGAITLEAIVYGAVLGGMLCAGILWFGAINHIITTDKIVYLFGRINPTIALAISMIFRFVPRLKHQMGKISEAQKLMGTVEKEGMFPGIRQGVKELSILVTWSLENSIEISDSMKSRGYGAGRRTAYRVFRLNASNIKIILFIAFCFIIFMVGFANGVLSCQYNPVIIINGLDFEMIDIITYIAWVIMVLFPVIF